MSSTDILIGYNKNDFFYVNATNKGEMPTAKMCDDLNVNDYKWDISCNNTHFLDNSANCLKKELCINKEYSDTIKELQQINSGSVEKYDNVTEEYDQTFLQTLNLGSGIIVMLILLYKFNFTFNKQ